MELRDIISLVSLVLLVLGGLIGVVLYVGSLREQLKQYATREQLSELARQVDKTQHTSDLAHERFATKVELEAQESKLENKLDVILSKIGTVELALVRLASGRTASPKPGEPP